MGSLEVRKRRYFQHKTTLASALVVAAAVYSACSTEGAGSREGRGTANGGSSGSGAGDGGTGGSSVGGGNTGGSGLGGSLNIDSGPTSDGSLEDAENCGAHSMAAENVTIEEEVTETITERAPADVYIMFDQSASMTAPEAGGVTRWQGVTQATISFLQSPDSAGLGVGIQFFGRAVLLEDCNAATYARPEVPIGVLPGNAQALVNAINSHQPSTETPTTAALTGAITYARQWKTQNPNHPVFVLLVTDGVPEVPVSSGTSCSGMVQDLPTTTAAAAAGMSTEPKIPTYVLGVGPSLANLDQIAQAGGTTKAYLITGGNVAQQVVDALNAIRGTISQTVTKTVTRTETVPLACEWLVPPARDDQTQDPEKVNVKLGIGGVPQQLGKVPSAADCATHQNAWYYDNPDAPTKIIACPDVCERIKTATDARVDILVGCETIIATPT